MESPNRRLPKSRRGRPPQRPRVEHNVRYTRPHFRPPPSSILSLKLNATETWSHICQPYNFNTTYNQCFVVTYMISTHLHVLLQQWLSNREYRRQFLLVFSFAGRSSLLNCCVSFLAPVCRSMCQTCCCEITVYDTSIDF